MTIPFRPADYLHSFKSILFCKPYENDPVRFEYKGEHIMK